MNIDPVKIGRIIAELREKNRLNQEELAARAGASAAAVRRWESGEELPDLESLARMASLFSVTVDDLLFGPAEERSGSREPAGKAAKKIFVIGCGRWGTFLGWYLHRVGHEVTIYGRPSSARMKELMATRKNEHLTLPDDIALTHSYDGLAGADIVVISVNAQHLADVAAELSAMGMKDKTLVLCMKGIEIETGRRLSQVVGEEVDPGNRVAVWLGPGHVQEFYRGVPNCMVIDSDDDDVKKELIRLFSSDLIRFYYGTDLLGNEIGAAAKNVVGIAAGMLEGAGMSSLKGALMARGTKEISGLIVAMGGKAASAYGLCHLGDYEATLFSAHSQNLAFGKSVVLGTAYHKLAEGYYTVKALLGLGKKYGVELPICEAVYGILYENADPGETLKSLFSRSLKREF